MNTAADQVRRMEAKAEEVYRRHHPGPDLLADFNIAPLRLQEEFWKAIRGEVEAEHSTALRMHAEDGLSPRFWSCTVRWDSTWQKRAGYMRRKEANGEPTTDEDYERQRRILREIPAEEYVRRLTGFEVPGRGQPMCCPLHEERTPSFRVYKWKVRCYGCGFRGGIYEFGGALWDIDLNSPRFREVHDRLYDALR